LAFIGQHTKSFNKHTLGGACHRELHNIHEIKMVLASLVDNGPELRISFDRVEDSSSCLSWSDFPLVGYEEVHKVPEIPLEFNPYIITKENGTILVDRPSTLYRKSSVSWSDFPITGCSENKSLRPSSNSIIPDRSINENKPLSKHRKTVSFNKFLEVRQHALTIGDHPMCRDSLPISLAWDHGDTMLMDLDGFEAQRKGFRRNRSMMKLSYFERKNMLRKVSGFTEAEIVHEQRRLQYTS